MEVELTEEEAKTILVALQSLKQTTTKDTVPESLDKLYPCGSYGIIRSTAKFCPVRALSL